jgi:hypothetical protein
MRKHCDILVPAMGLKARLVSERESLEARIAPLHEREMEFCDDELTSCSQIATLERCAERNQPGKPGASPNRLIFYTEMIADLRKELRSDHLEYLRFMRTLRPLYAEHKRLLAEEAKCDRIIAFCARHYG